MSGGLDSSVAVALLKEQGCDVFGVTAKMWPSDSRCCSDEDVRTAQAAAARLGVPHHTFDLLKYFERDVVRYFVDEYSSGRTPSPCAVCNPRIKFGVLMDRAIELGADCLATGHYARIRTDSRGNCHLLRGKDPAKDQSYFLFGLSQQQLRRVRFPLGDRTKQEARELARHFGLTSVLGERSESQDLCFVNPGEHWKLTEVYRPDLAGDGRFLSVSGDVLGRHCGIHRYTIGQRRGLGVAAPNPLYVAEIHADTGDIVLAERQHLTASAMLVESVNWPGGKAPTEPFAAATKIRYRQQGAPSRIIPRSDHAVLVQFETPQFAVTPGQVAAFYQDDELIGGGWIHSAQTP